MLPSPLNIFYRHACARKINVCFVVCITGYFLVILVVNVDLLPLLLRDWNPSGHLHRETAGRLVYGILVLNCKVVLLLSMYHKLLIYLLPAVCGVELDHHLVLTIMIVLMGKGPW